MVYLGYVAALCFSLIWFFTFSKAIRDYVAANAEFDKQFKRYRDAIEALDKLNGMEAERESKSEEEWPRVTVTRGHKWDRDEDAQA